MAVESKKSGPSCLDLASTMAAVPFYAAGIAQGSSLLAVPAGLFLAYQLGRAYMALR
ncbi:MAG: hypothetical protein QGH82_02685 [Candidatus Woesearchaeota archaeon]|nr:hypothetical protein [Candidatus Woesearchaeota archaeon]